MNSRMDEQTQPAIQIGPSSQIVGATPRLKKNLKPHWVWAIALGSAIGWGAFVLPPDWMATAGPLGAILGLSIGGALMILIGVSYGYLAQSFPVSGGAFAYTLVGFGRTHAFICAWFMNLGYISIVALNASALALLAKRVVPQVAEQGYLYNIAGWDVYLGEVLIAISALVVFSILNIRGASMSGRAQFLFCIVMVAAVLVLLLGVLLSPSGTVDNVAPVWNPDVSPIAGTLAILAIAPWAYIGFDNIPQAAEEFDFPARKSFRLIFWSLVGAILLYSAMVIVTASAQPWLGLVEAGGVWGTADAVTGTMGSPGLLVLSVAAFMGIATGLNGFYVAGSRVMLAMGRAQMVPSVFRKIHPRFGTPHVSIVFVMAICLIAPWFGRTALSWIVDMASLGFTFAFMYTCATAFKVLRWNRQEEHPGIESSRSTAKKLAAGAGVLVALAFTVLLLAPGSPAQLSGPSLLAMAAWILLGVVFYLVRRKHSLSINDDEVDRAVLGKPRPETLRRVTAR